MGIGFSKGPSKETTSILFEDKVICDTITLGYKTNNG